MKRPNSSDDDSLGGGGLFPVNPNTLVEEKGPYPRGGYRYGLELEEDDDDVVDGELCSPGSGAGQVTAAPGGGEKKRRLSTVQVKALERNFEVENKLEPERKVRLAQELGLQPRQVAVWFQNRRARWKTKQLERDFAVLKSDHDTLLLSVDTLHRDNESLLSQIKELRAKLAEEEGYRSTSVVKEEPAESETNDNNEKKTTIEVATAAVVEKDEEVEEEEEEEEEVVVPASDSSDSSAILNEETSYHPKLMDFSSSPPPQQQQQELVSASPLIYHFQHHQSSAVVVRMAPPPPPPPTVVEEHNFFGADEPCSSSFFVDEQPPTLYWYCPDQWS